MSHRRVATPICKVCIDAGKPENIFTSHFTKNRDGKVCCPTLLSQKCRRCGNSGHTVKYCNSKICPSTPPPTYTANMVAPCAPKKKCGFAVLDDSSDEEDEGEAYFAESCDFPRLTTIKTEPVATTLNNWAEIAAKPAVVVEEDKPKPSLQVLHKTKRYINWADCESSDDEEDF